VPRFSIHNVFEMKKEMVRASPLLVEPLALGGAACALMASNTRCPHAHPH
jgi:hypothetical protein